MSNIEHTQNTGFEHQPLYTDQSQAPDLSPIDGQSNVNDNLNATAENVSNAASNTLNSTEFQGYVDSFTYNLNSLTNQSRAFLENSIGNLNSFIVETKTEASKFIESNLNSTLKTAGDFRDGVVNGISSQYNQVVKSSEEFVTYVQDSASDLKNRAVSNTYAGIDSIAKSDPVRAVVENKYVTKTSNLIKENPLFVGYAASTVGGAIVADSGLKLIRNDSSTNKRLESAKLLTGVAMVGTSVALASEENMDKAVLVICSLASALARTAWVASTPHKTHQLFVLKTKV